MAGVTMASLAIEFERRKHEQADGVRDLKALCIRHGGPSGSDWGELLAWLEGRLERSGVDQAAHTRHLAMTLQPVHLYVDGVLQLRTPPPTKAIIPKPDFDFDEGPIS